MPKPTNPNGPVYPTDIYGGSEPNFKVRVDQVPGITLRQEFAKAAMQAILSNPHLIDEISNDVMGTIVVYSVKMADALIAGLNTKELNP